MSTVVHTTSKTTGSTSESTHGMADASLDAAEERARGNASTYMVDRAKGSDLLNQPSIRLASLLFRLPDLRPTKAQDRGFTRWTQVGDPVADALVARIKAGGGQALRLQFEQALEHGIESVAAAPEELVAFFQAVETVPYWVDPERLERGSRIYTAIGADIMNVFVLGLSMSYLAQDANEVLLRSGDLHTKAARRAAETLTWVGEITLPGALYPGEAGYRAALRVRLTHAFMRSGIRNRPDWPESELPIHQATYVATPLLFCLMTILLGTAHGHWMTRKDRDAVHHLWRYATYLVGVHPDLIAANEADQWRMAAIQLDHQVRLDEQTRTSGRELGGALIDSYATLYGLDPDSAKDAKRLKQIHARNTLIMHLFLGKQAAQTLGFDDPKIAAALPVAVHAAANAVRRGAAYAVPSGRRRYEDRQRERAIDVLLAADRRVDVDLTYSRTGA